MKFVEMTGATLVQLVADDEIHADDLVTAGVADDCIVRINEQGDIEVRRPTQWELIGGLLGDYENRIRQQTGIDWV
ncbi:MAG: hypothetical protein HN617_09400 [Planctomycetaceae bacterium]|jgi:hypothetical protein|nr:hypothetical protein [Planctomycetaceae bacterium]MBT4013584.1 hypothetical protein [Planctomycetaceae bacterium]MBT4725977.1 hypothetical protein [Planctomycetaceae bacterium]MBT4844427.1 hypothetical protein [Planctomycetaceae bacterium]MBT5124471.1 hypothetical protein [Planctomycetaceae bacterium]